MPTTNNINNAAALALAATAAFYFEGCKDADGDQDPDACKGVDFSLENQAVWMKTLQDGSSKCGKCIASWTGGVTNPQDALDRVQKAGQACGAKGFGENLQMAHDLQEGKKNAPPGFKFGDTSKWTKGLTPEERKTACKGNGKQLSEEQGQKCAQCVREVIAEQEVEASNPRTLDPNEVAVKYCGAEGEVDTTNKVLGRQTSGSSRRNSLSLDGKKPCAYAIATAPTADEIDKCVECISKQAEIGVKDEVKQFTNCGATPQLLAELKKNQSSK